MKVTATQDFSNVQTFEDLRRYSSAAVNSLIAVVNGNIGFSDNCSANLLGVTFVAANTQYSFDHSLGRVPAGYLPASLSANMVLFSGKTQNTVNKIYLQSSAIGNGKVLVF